MEKLYLLILLSTLGWLQPSEETQKVSTPVAKLGSQSYSVQPAPTLPFFDWNACPFEGCSYRKWTAEAAVDVFDTWKPNRKRIAALPAKAVVTGVSGVVITYKPGVIRLNRDLPQEDLRRGDTILTYTYQGEGFSVVWFHGRFYRWYDITFAKRPDGNGGCQDDCAGVYVDLGEKVWWAKVKMRSGVVGWVNMEKASFGGVDLLTLVAPDSLPARRIGHSPLAQSLTAPLVSASRVHHRLQGNCYWVSNPAFGAGRARPKPHYQAVLSFSIAWRIRLRQTSRPSTIKVSKSGGAFLRPHTATRMG
jgi:hypothetical protein